MATNYQTYSLPAQMVSLFPKKTLALVILAKIKIFCSNGDLGKKLNFTHLSRKIQLPRTTIIPHIKWLLEIGLIQVVDGKIKHVNIPDWIACQGIEINTYKVFQFTKSDFERSPHSLAKDIRTELIAYTVHKKERKKQLSVGKKRLVVKGTKSSDDLGLSRAYNGAYLSNTEAGSVLKKSKSTGARYKKAAEKEGKIQINRRRDIVKYNGELDKAVKYQDLSDYDRDLLEKYYEERRFHVIPIEGGFVKQYEDLCFLNSQHELFIKTSISLLFRMNSPLAQERKQKIKRKFLKKRKTQSYLKQD